MTETLLTRHDLQWMEEAACAGIGGFTEAPFAEQVPVCRQCPVRFDCLEYGLSDPSALLGFSSVYGGLSAVQLSQIARAREGKPALITERKDRPRAAYKPKPARGPVALTCDQCGQSFGAKTSRAIYCSGLCRQRANVASLKARADAAWVQHRATA